MAKAGIPEIPAGVLDAMGHLVVVVDASGGIVFANSAAAAFLRFDREELVGQPVEVLVPEAAREIHAGHRESYHRAPAPRPMGTGRELLAVRSDGTEVRVEITLDTASIGGNAYVVCSLHDVTRLRAREDRLQQIVDSMPGLFYIFDAGGRLIWWNRRLGEVLGYADEELAGRHVLDFIHPDDRDLVGSRMAELFGDGVPRTAEYRLVLKDGRTIPYAGTGALCQMEGAPHMAGLTMDVSELRETQAELQRRIAEIDGLRRRLEAENTYLRAEVELAHRHGDIVGESPSIRKVLAEVEQVAAKDSTVLLLGETGTGKELIAQRVHDLSPRSARQMIKVNCAALPATLMEAELFGREKGAYTGAVSREPGRFEIADGSTLFLDEVGELPLEPAHIRRRSLVSDR